MNSRGKQDLGQDCDTCSPTEGDRVRIQKAALKSGGGLKEQSKKTKVAREKAENSHNLLHWAVTHTGDGSGDTVLSLAGDINEQKRIKMLSLHKP